VDSDELSAEQASPEEDKTILFVAGNQGRMEMAALS